MDKGVPGFIGNRLQEKPYGANALHYGQIKSVSG